MKFSIKFFEIFGISVRIHIAFLMFILFFASFIGFMYGFIAGLKITLFFIILFSIVVLHELSHSIVAIEFGFKVKSITLYPIGGAADVEIEENPKAELLMAFAGPLFNILCAWICLILLMFLTPNFAYYLNYPKIIEEIYTPNEFLDIPTIFGLLIWINFMLAVFNLLPAFPMDGGRILRAFLALFMDYLKATKISSIVAKIFFAIMMVVGLLMMMEGYSLTGLMFLVIAMFLYAAGEGEVKFIEMKQKFAGMKNKDIAIQLPEVDGNLTIKDMINLNYFSPFYSPFQPFFVVSLYGKVEGIINLKDIMDKIVKNKKDVNVPIYKVMKKEIVFIDANEYVTKSFGKILSSDLCIIHENEIVLGYILREAIINS